MNEATSYLKEKIQKTQKVHYILNIRLVKKGALSNVQNEHMLKVGVGALLVKLTTNREHIVHSMFLTLDSF